MSSANDTVPPKRREADRILHDTLHRFELAGVPETVAIDRLLTFGAYMATLRAGKSDASAQLAEMSRIVGEGLFDA